MTKPVTNLKDKIDAANASAQDRAKDLTDVQIYRANGAYMELHALAVAYMVDETTSQLSPDNWKATMAAVQSLYDVIKAFEGATQEEIDNTFDLMQTGEEA